jgi:hypothetical protein
MSASAIDIISRERYQVPSIGHDAERRTASEHVDITRVQLHSHTLECAVTLLCEM